MGRFTPIPFNFLKLSNKYMINYISTKKYLELLIMKFHYYVLSIAIFCLPACSSVEPTKESSAVTLVKSFNVEACKKLGSTNATVTKKVGIITRGDDVVMEELIIVAKNRAAKMGGDSIVANEPVVDGSMSFDIYKCAQNKN